jgi:uncharacterized protein (TIGR03083 family)
MTGGEAPGVPAAGGTDDPRALVGLLEATWTSTLGVLEALDGDEWALPTDCPGWTVQDVAAHIVGVEAMFMGKPLPDVGEHEWPHVRSDMGRAIEAWVESYRGRPPADVLADLHGTVADRLAFWSALDDDGWATETFTPVGPGTFATLVPFRVFDSWLHEQDIRRAVGRPGDFTAPVARWNLRRCSQPLGRSVVRGAGAPDGTRVEWLAHGPPIDHRFAVDVRAGRGVVVEGEGPGAPAVAATVRVITDLVTFVRLCCGRVDPDAALAAGLVRFRGDRALGEAVVRTMAFTP